MVSPSSLTHCSPHSQDNTGLCLFFLLYQSALLSCIKYIEYGSASVGGRPCLSRVLAKTALMAVTTQIMRIFAGGRLCECSAEMHVDFRGVSFRQRGAFCVFLIDSPG